MARTPYMLIEQAKAPMISRQLRQTFGRMAFVTDEGTVELTVSSNGHWSVQVGPPPQKGGEFRMVARGHVGRYSEGSGHHESDHEGLPVHREEGKG